MAGQIVIYVILSLSLLQSCSLKPVVNSEEQRWTTAIETDALSIKQELLIRYADWYDVPYRYGGLSRKGIDCSGFVYLTYRDLFDTNLPRTSQQQAKQGILVSKDELKAGDLVFFKVGKNQNHVGIFIENKKFLHVSTKKGVILSKLDNRFWSARYWKAVRVLNETER